MFYSHVAKEMEHSMNVVKWGRIDHSVGHSVFSLSPQSTPARGLKLLSVPIFCADFFQRGANGTGVDEAADNDHREHDEFTAARYHEDGQ